ncbi:pickpocket protein 28 [Folsomia candida]|uniref:pickpocket protein 28 n=1 Tax=Folsomia candida TaxID=158441 RepID=UPI001605304E|nr:pickpocket protein 28 [Folsomia candida]
MHFNAQNHTENSLCLRFLRDSTIHGLKYLSQRKRPHVERICWLLTLLTSLGASAYLIYGIIEKWNASPVIVSFQPSQTSVMDVPFPAVTVCSSNRFKKSAVDRFLRDVNSEDPEESHIAKSVLRQLDHVCSLSNTFSTYFNYSLNETTVNACERLGIGCGNHPGMLASENIPYPVLLQFALSFQSCGDMIPLCLWEGKKLNMGSCEEIFKPVITDMGFCCTFNSVPRQYLLRNESIFLSSAISEEDVRFWEAFNLDNLLETDHHTNKGYRKHVKFQKKAGQTSGLSFLVNTDANEYFCANHDSFGFRVHAHSLVEVSHVAEFGVAIAPNSELFLSLQAEVTKSEKAIRDMNVERRKCYYSDEHRLDSFTFYTASNCLDQCLSEEIAKGCNCIRFDLALKFSSVEFENVTYCEGPAFKCAKLVMGNVSKVGTEIICPHCKPTCNKIEYIAQLSSLRLREDFTIRVELDEEDEGNTPDNFVRPNASIVHVFFGSDNVYSRVRKNMYDSNDFFAHIGGILGLFLGLSVISAVEPINLLFWKIAQIFSKKSKVNPQNQSPDTTLRNDRSFYAPSPKNYYAEMPNASQVPWFKNQYSIFGPTMHGNRLHPKGHDSIMSRRY